MPSKSSTWMVPSSADGSYTRPDTIQSRIAAKMKLLPRVDHNGRDLLPDTADPSVTELVTPPTAPPTMGAALAAAAEAVGADLPQLLDSERFRLAVAGCSPADSLGLQDLIRDFQPAPAAPTMRPNPAQGAPGASAPGRPSGSILERMHDLAEKSLTQPEPPGSTFR